MRMPEEMMGKVAATAGAFFAAVVFLAADDEEAARTRLFENFFPDGDSTEEELRAALVAVAKRTVELLERKDQA